MLVSRERREKGGMHPLLECLTIGRPSSLTNSNP